ncbi:MAG: AraC family transcriptional regulator [Myxococcota bacterium]
MFDLDQGGAGSTAVRHAVPRDLAGLVAGAWSQKRGGAHAWRIVPDTCSHLVFWRSETQVSLSVVGARRTFVDIDSSSRDLTVGVRLCVGVLPVLMRDRANLFTDRGIALSVPQVLARASVREVLAGILGWVRERAAGEVDARLRAYLAGESTLPARSRQRLFQRDVGIGACEFRRIDRLHRAIRLRQVGHAWARIASDAGYSDQPHLAREFQALVGESPTAFLGRGRNLQDAGRSSP